MTASDQLSELSQWETLQLKSRLQSFYFFRSRRFFDCFVLFRVCVCCVHKLYSQYYVLWRSAYRINLRECVCVSSFTKRTIRYCWLLGENTKIMLQHDLQSVWRSVHHRMHPTQYIVYGNGPSWYEPRPGNDFENGQLCKFFFSFVQIFDKVHMRYATICYYCANAIFRHSKYCGRETACVIRIISPSLPLSHCIAIATCTIRWQWTLRHYSHTIVQIESFEIAINANDIWTSYSSFILFINVWFPSYIA